jgi:hypothetical protein
MTKKTSNAYFTFLYPKYGDGRPSTEDDPRIAIPHSGEFVTIDGERYGGECSGAVFYDPAWLRGLAAILDDAADLLDAAREKASKGE